MNDAVKNDEAEAVVNPVAVPTKKAPAAKWTAEQVKALEDGYEVGNTASVEALMIQLDKSKRQVVGKLVSMGLYAAPEAAPKKAKDDGPTKGEILNAIDKAAVTVDLGDKFSEGLQGSTKPALNRVLNMLTDLATAE